MNIHAKEGDKVVFSYPDNSLDNDTLEIDGEVIVFNTSVEKLEVGTVYTVDYTEVFSWKTDVYLKEFPSVSFNSGHFIDYR